MSDREIFTHSASQKLLMCPRAYYWSYEVGLRRQRSGEALRFGSAWARAMEARWHGKPIEEAYALALGDGNEVDELMAATIGGLLAAYYAYWQNDPVKELMPEVEFRLPIAGSRTFDSGGKMDGRGIMHDGRRVLIEHKTAGEDIDANSDYWLRLRLNQQCMNYVMAERTSGGDFDCVLYDVTRKPAISPLASVNDLDENGLKIVMAADGTRVIKKDGTPKQTADKEKGETVKSHPETCEEFSQRLYADAMARPEFYFARREVPILESDLEDFQIQRLGLTRNILHLRQQQKRAKRPEYAWPRHVNGMICRTCEYSEFCLQSISIDPANPPAGFAVGKKHQELAAGEAK